MRYEKEIDEFLRAVIFESWMSEEEYQEVLEESMGKLGISKETLNENLETGVLNGYPVNVQLDMAIKTLKYLQ
jgi:hypothetical protein